MSDFVLLVGFFIIAMAAIGVGEFIWGVLTIMKPPRTQLALDRWLKHMKAFGAQHLTSDQFDRETLVVLARYQRRIQGTVLSGMGGGIVIGSIAAIGVSATLYHFYANAGDAPIPSLMELLYPIVGLGANFGIGVSAMIVATTGARTPRPSLPESARRISNFRSPWFLLVNCLMFAVSAVLPALFITNTAPQSFYTDTFYGQRPQVGLLVLASVLVGAMILLAESVSWLLTRYPLLALGLPPAVEAQLLPCLPAFAISQVWGQFTIMGVFFLISSEALSDFSFHLMLLAPAVGIPYVLFGVVSVFSQSGVSWASMANAVTLAAKPKATAQGE